MIGAALARRTDTRGDAFAMTVAGQRYTKRAEAAARLRQVIGEQIAAVPRGHVERGVELGAIGGFTLTATLAPQYANSVALTLEGIPDHPAPLVLNHRELPDKAGIITRLENRLAGLEEARASIRGHGRAPAQRDRRSPRSDRRQLPPATGVRPGHRPARRTPSRPDRRVQARGRTSSGRPGCRARPRQPARERASNRPAAAPQTQAVTSRPGRCHPPAQHTPLARKPASPQPRASRRQRQTSPMRPQPRPAPAARQKHGH